MRIEQFMFIHEVAKTNSMSAAAANLFVTPQYISKAIKQLEEELGVAIFRRTKTGVYLTLSGEKICQITDNILEQIAALSEISQIKKAPTAVPIGEYTIYTSAETNQPLIYSQYRALLSEYPELKLRIYEADSTIIMNSVLNGTLAPDVFVVAMDIGDMVYCDLVEQKYSSYTIYEDHLSVAVAANHEALDANTRKNGISGKNISNFRFGFCSIGKNNHNLIMQLLFQHGLTTNANVFVQNSGDIYRLVKDGTCAAVIPGISEESYRQNGLCVVPFRDKISIVYRIFIRRDIADDSFCQCLLKNLQAQYRKSFRPIR